MLCCCKRKPNNNFQMLNLQRNAHSETKDLSNIYDLILSPCDNTDLIPETPPKQIITPRKSNIYINFFEENDFECITPLFDCNIPSTPTTPNTASTPNTSSTPSTPTSINYYTRPITPSIPINYNRRHSTPPNYSTTPPNYSTTPPNYSTTPPNYSTTPPMSLTSLTPINYTSRPQTPINYTSRPQTPINYCTTPRMYQDINGNMIHIQIPRNSDLYVNYEKFDISN
jgi:hypothetical protein